MAIRPSGTLIVVAMIVSRWRPMAESEFIFAANVAVARSSDVEDVDVVDSIVIEGADAGEMSEDKCNTLLLDVLLDSRLDVVVNPIGNVITDDDVLSEKPTGSPATVTCSSKPVSYSMLVTP